MSLFDDHPLTALDRKAHAALGDKVVVKSLAAAAGFHHLPRYVSEYLLAKCVRTDVIVPAACGGAVGTPPAGLRVHPVATAREALELALVGGP